MLLLGLPAQQILSYCCAPLLLSEYKYQRNIVNSAVCCCGIQNFPEGFQTNMNEITLEVTETLY